MAKETPRAVTFNVEQTEALHLLDQARKDAALAFEAANQAFHKKIGELLEAHGISLSEASRYKITLDLNTTPAKVTLSPNKGS